MLSEQQVEKIRFLYDKTSCSMQRIADNMGISLSSVIKYLDNRDLKGKKMGKKVENDSGLIKSPPDFSITDTKLINTTRGLLLLWRTKSAGVGEIAFRASGSEEIDEVETEYMGTEFVMKALEHWVKTHEHRFHH